MIKSLYYDQFNQNLYYKQVNQDPMLWWRYRAPLNHCEEPHKIAGVRLTLYTVDSTHLLTVPNGSPYKEPTGIPANLRLKTRTWEMVWIPPLVRQRLRQGGGGLFRPTDFPPCFFAVFKKVFMTVFGFAICKTATNRNLLVTLREQYIVF